MEKQIGMLVGKKEDLKITMQHVKHGVMQIRIVSSVQLKGVVEEDISV
ncbi:MAG: hypothetical protein ACMUHX_10320 [bacterium]